MTRKTPFAGFPRECLTFYRGLARNNEKAWFDGHRDEFERFVMEPARLFVLEMGARLQSIAPGIHADPRVNRSIFRLFRDTRFSPDKTPYKTHLGIWLWEGEGPRMECSGFYFQLEPKEFYLGVGIYMLPRHYLDAYRAAVVDRRHGPALRRAVQAALELPGSSLGGRQYKRVPRGFDPDHPNAELLLHGGLYCGVGGRHPRVLHTPEIVGYCHERFAAMAPLHRWLQAFTKRVRE